MCGQVEAEVREGKVGVRYVKDGEEGWIPVVRGRSVELELCISYHRCVSRICVGNSNISR